jgi:hypothetical protein
MPAPVPDESPARAESASAARLRKARYAFIWAWVLFLYYLGLPVLQHNRSNVLHGWQLLIATLGSFAVPFQSADEINHPRGTNLLLFWVFFSIPFLFLQFALLCVPLLIFTRFHHFAVRAATKLAGWCLTYLGSTYVFVAFLQGTHRLQIGYYALLLASVSLFYAVQLRVQAMQLNADVSPENLAVIAPARITENLPPQSHCTD